MVRKGTKKDAAQPQATAQQLGSLIKSARDIMRKDKGLNGDLDRLPMLTWIMFLKFLDDMELLREQEATLAKERFRATIERPYRWRDWAAKEDGITGAELVAFVNQEEAIRPDGSRGPGLFAHLRGLQSANGRDRRDVVATVFRGVINRMVNGYLLRDVINKVNAIHFSSSEEIHTIGHFYETMLREMRDAAGDSGEFYTPRPVVQLMVTVTDPQLGEVLLDPAAGTGGFLVESFGHIGQQCKTVQDRRILQHQTIHGQEAKPLPYLLCQMNLLLHGLEYPEITYGNSLAEPVQQIGDRSRVDVVLTNPPFGGEEEAGIKANFPDHLHTSETALLFLQLIMRKLKRPEKNKGKPGRAAIVVPNSVLADAGVASRIKAELLEHYNLHTVVRLPNGVFSPYTPIPTNLLFFERGGPTTTIWYYEFPLPQGLREYTKTRPLQFNEFEPLKHWWNSRTETDHAWIVDATGFAGCEHIDLDIRNPKADAPLRRLTSSQLLVQAQASTDLAVTCLRQIGELMREQEQTGDKQVHWVPLAELVSESREPCAVDPSEKYPNFGIYSFGRGTFAKAPIDGLETRATTLYRVRAGQFIYSRLFAFEGAFALVPSAFDEWYVSNEYPAFTCDSDHVEPEYLLAYFRSPSTWSLLRALSKGLGHRRQRVQPSNLKKLVIPVPPLDRQKRIAKIQSLRDRLHELNQTASKEILPLVPLLIAELNQPVPSMFSHVGAAAVV